MLRESTKRRTKPHSIQHKYAVLFLFSYSNFQFTLARVSAHYQIAIIVLRECVNERYMNNNALRQQLRMEML